MIVPVSQLLQSAAAIGRDDGTELLLSSKTLIEICEIDVDAGPKVGDQKPFLFSIGGIKRQNKG